MLLVGRIVRIGSVFEVLALIGEFRVLVDEFSVVVGECGVFEGFDFFDFVALARGDFRSKFF